MRFNFTVLVVLISGLLCVGCNTHSAVDSQSHSDHQHHGHSHASEGPHQGHLIELGKEEYHAELTHDHVTKAVNIYLLDSSAKRPIDADASDVLLNLVIDDKPSQFTFVKARRNPDLSEESDSQFTSTDEELLEILETEEASGRLNVRINGKPYSGDVHHHGHDGEHDHHHVD